MSGLEYCTCKGTQRPSGIIYVTSIEMRFPTLSCCASGRRAYRYRQKLRKMDPVPFLDTAVDPYVRFLAFREYIINQWIPQNAASYRLSTDVDPIPLK